MNLDELIRTNGHITRKICADSPDTTARHIEKNTKALISIKGQLEGIEDRIIASGDYAIVDIYMKVTEILKGDL